MLCGGLAGVVTWASIFPLGTWPPRSSCYGTLLIVLDEDVIKTRVQTWDVVTRSQASSVETATQPLLRTEQVAVSGRQSSSVRPSAFRIAKEAYTTEGISVFFRGLGICSARAFLVNAVQWAVRRLAQTPH